MFLTSMTRNQQNPPFSKLHIELLEQFESSRTFTKFIAPKNRTGKFWFRDMNVCVFWRVCCLSVVWVCVRVCV